MKNKHLEHLEDDILNNGSEGGKTSIAFLRSLGSMLSEGDKNNVKVTTKWDGAPAIVCGIDPITEYFFVGNKSVFNIDQPKICVSSAGIDQHYPESGLKSIGGVEGLLKLPGIAQTPAGRNQRIISIDGLFLSGFGVRSGKAALALFQAIYEKTGFTPVEFIAESSD